MQTEQSGMVEKVRDAVVAEVVLKQPEITVSKKEQTDGSLPVGAGASLGGESK